jgi:hypothetical protein
LPVYGIKIGEKLKNYLTSKKDARLGITKMPKDETNRIDTKLELAPDFSLIIEHLKNPVNIQKRFNDKIHHGG